MSWETSNGGFDPSAFYPDGIQPSGKFAKSPTPIRMDEQMLAICEQIAINPHIPQLRTTSDVVRDGAARGIHNALSYLDSIGQGNTEANASFKILIAGMKVREMANNRAYVTESIEKLKEELRSASPQYREQLIDQAQEMRESAFHQEHIDALEEILRK